MAVGNIPSMDLPPVRGFRMAATASGVKTNGTLDLLLVEMEPHCSVAGVFTKNRVPAAPVQLCRERASYNVAEGLIVNSGNANASTGIQGMLDCKTMASAAATALGVPAERIFVSSTGVIGEPLPVHHIVQATPELANQLTDDGWKEAAEAIMTTDTFPKGSFRQFEVMEHAATVVGIAKGSGMIHPDMATMLGFLFTDSAITSQALQVLLSRAVEASFNSISVDGDTSTNDTVLVFASGRAEHALIDDPDDPQAQPLAQALCQVCRDLAQTIVRDGEGATKFITVTVKGAGSETDAKQVGLTVAGSSLVKTACFGSDPNWGRIIAAVGNAGVELTPETITIHLGDVLIVEQGGRADSYTEAAGQAVMDQEEITITIDLGLGDAESTVWTSDLSHEYVTINADYRT
ncbi:MAG: bifunctional glutamate N-acetyltransferase/amino-acid acetyltransferase ArgJ [Magnetococcales bacterium]|nr:bifunctional glutamate N-acetyltransferase/amino-acid acetyltransferase ArgJ [Magnetococcales bacterium]